ncbi:MAG: VTT domain-containing protein [Gammaproteobacteria bacterium]|nr:VTT domain-containing protein [Gammaproteobacteria bacterium]
MMAEREVPNPHEAGVEAALAESERAAAFRVTGLIPLLLIILLVLAVYLLPIPGLADRLRAYTQQIAALGWYSPLLYLSATALLTAVGIPRLLLYTLAGGIYGFFWGLLWSQIGVLIGAYATFGFARWSGRRVSFERWPKLKRFAQLVSRRGVLAVLMIRQLPLNSISISIFLGLTRVRHRHFLIGSFIGFLPAAIPATLIGAGLAQGDLTRNIQYASAGVVSFILISLGLRWLLYAPASPFKRAAAGRGEERS